MCDVGISFGLRLLWTLQVYILQGDANSVLGNCLDAAWGPRFGILRAEGLTCFEGRYVVSRNVHSCAFVDVALMTNISPQPILHSPNFVV